jgi:hypothetical protein
MIYFVRERVQSVITFADRWRNYVVCFVNGCQRTFDKRGVFEIRQKIMKWIKIRKTMIIHELKTDARLTSLHFFFGWISPIFVANSQVLKTLKTLLFAAFLGCVASPAFSQQEFKEGFIVKKDQEYTYGYISYTDTPHLNCVFKEEANGIPATYTTSQIVAYGTINGNHFRKRSIDFPGESSEKEVFIEAIADGTVTLYVAFKRIFIERGSSFYELKNEKEKLASYRSVVASLLSNCGNAEKKAQSVAIEVQALKSLVEAYNQCAAEGKSTTRKKTKSEKGIGLFIGVDRTQFSISKSSIDFLDNKSFTDRTLLSGGINYKITPKRSNHFSFVTGLWFNDQRFYLATEDNTTPGSQVQIFRINYQVLRLPILLEAGNFTSSKVQPYAKAGFTVPIMLKREVTLNQEIENNNNIYIDKYEASENFTEPLLVHVIAGASLPVSEKLHVFGEAFYSFGKSKFKLEMPKEGTVNGNFNSLGLNVGLVISY